MNQTSQADPDSPDSERWDLRLYVAGQTPKSMAAFANLKQLCVFFFTQ